MKQKGCSMSKNSKVQILNLNQKQHFFLNTLITYLFNYVI